MEVLLRQDVEKLGRMGEVVDVANGYARNYLLPKQIEPFTQGCSWFMELYPMFS